ncbi:MAG TPA: cytochrome c3 family protein [Blastocatellia bacterium]|nr:cytochrome c3 family protein [Blastocatellia bacterium]
MHVKLTIVVLYALAFAAAAASTAPSLASPPRIESTQTQTQRVAIRFDSDGRRGLVLFDHKKHEALIDPDPSFPHKTPAGVACTGCHHSVKDITIAAQFQKCSACHKTEGNPDNPEDREGYDLNSREIFHRLCIGCHRASNVKASNDRFSNVSFTKCSECHDRGAPPGVIAQTEEQPPPDEINPPVVRPGPPAVELIRTPVDPPRGYAGSSRIETAEQTSPDAVPRTDRWRIGFPEDPRFEEGAVYNPYRQNVLKGDYPIFRQHNFLVITAESDSLFNVRKLPVPSDVSSQRPDSAEFFGRGMQAFFRQNFVVSFDLFHGDTAFKPVDWRVHITPNFNINHLNTQENGIVNIDPRRGANRLDGYIALQEAFAEVRLGDTNRFIPFLRGRGSKDGESPYFDTTSIRTGIQPFVSDFRGFIFNDVNLGTRLFGNAANNRYQFNAAYFYMLEKDTNSELNTRDFRDQAVFVANLFRQDTLWHGYTSQFSFHFNNDRPSRHFDENDFLVRPAFVGDIVPHGIKAAYFGWAGEGHIGRYNITHALYQAIGHDTHNQIAGRRTDINAQMAAAELSFDRDWLRFKGSFFWSSGDSNPFDNKARGFDAILDLPDFAGGKFSLWNSQGIRLTQTGVALVNPESLLPSLRSSKTEGQANFVNPGLFLYNLGLDADLTPKLKGILNLNYLQFHHTETLEGLLFQPGIRKSIGLDYGAGVVFRPFLNENTIVTGGISSLIPGVGFKDIFTSNCSGSGCGTRGKVLYSAFVRVKFTY